MSEQFIPISNSEAWDFYLENLKLKQQIKELNIELSLTKNPIYCEECDSCGEVPGCCDVHRCLYLNIYQGEYDDLVKENEKLQNELNDVYSTLRDNLFKSINETSIKEQIKSFDLNYVDERFCEHCNDYTNHDCKNSGYERDSSQDYERCLICNYYTYGIDGIQNALN